MNLIYACVFHQHSYINLLKLLITSISVKGNINSETTDVLVITSPTFQPIIQQELENFDLPLKYHVLDLHTLMEASCCKLKIFQYDEIDKYQKILYLDTDVLVNSDVNVLFNTEISSDKLYALEEGVIGHEYWGNQFFDFTKYSRTISAFSAGVFYFMNSLSMKQLFENTNNHIADYLGKSNNVPQCLDQPFLVYNSVIEQKYDNQFMKKYLENNPNVVNRDIIIYHFPGWPGNYSSKIDKMSAFWDKMKIETFYTRNEMLKYYCSKLSNPKIVEIGVFRGDFLDFLVKNCSFESIDAIDLFEGVTCSGDADGNNVVYYDVGKSYLELVNKYKNVLNVRMHKTNSITFLQSQEDDTYDIIYIDGDHSYNGVKNDLVNAYNKIKNGGYIMGHDYEMNMEKTKNVYEFGVKRAVDEFCITHNQQIISKALDGCVSYCMKINKPASP
jgi:lipopolysaccharide biosynthesis glycosyltransferase